MPHDIDDIRRGNFPFASENSKLAAEALLEGSRKVFASQAAVQLAAQREYRRKTTSIRKQEDHNRRQKKISNTLQDLSPANVSENIDDDFPTVPVYHIPPEGHRDFRDVEKCCRQARKMMKQLEPENKRPRLACFIRLAC